MLLLVDTCFWNHNLDLFKSKIFDIRPILFDHTIVLTEEVKKEIIHYKIDIFVPLNQIYILPISKDEFDKYSDLDYLDDADRTLIIAYDKKLQDFPFILTDDEEFLEECLQTNKRVMNLPQFMLELVREDLVKKNTVAKCLKFWTKRKTHKKKEIKKWKLELQNIL